MRALILIILLSGPAYSGWRPAPISGIEQEEKNRAISYNLNNAAIQINRKIDKFGKDTIYSDLTFNGDMSFVGSSTFTGTISIGISTHTASISNTAYIRNHWQVVASTTTAQQQTSTITFTGIEPDSNYHLIIYGTASDEGASNLFIRCNGESGNVYKLAFNTQDSSGAGGQGNDAYSSVPLTYVGNSMATSSYFRGDILFNTDGADASIAAFNANNAIGLSEIGSKFYTYHGTGYCDVTNPITEISIYTDYAGRELGAYKYTLLKLIR